MTRAISCRRECLRTTGKRVIQFRHQLRRHLFFVRTLRQRQCRRHKLRLQCFRIFGCDGVGQHQPHADSMTNRVQYGQNSAH